MNGTESPQARGPEQYVGLPTEVMSDPRAVEELSRIGQQFGHQARIIIPNQHNG